MEGDGLLQPPIYEAPLLHQLQKVLQRYAALQQSGLGRAPPGAPAAASLDNAWRSLVAAAAEQAVSGEGAAECHPSGSSTNGSSLGKYREDLLRLARQMPRVNRLTFSAQTLMWVVRVQTRSARVCRSFSVRKFGFLEARQQALEFLRHFDEAATNPGAAAPPPVPAATTTAPATAPLLLNGEDARLGSSNSSGVSCNIPSEPSATTAAGAGETPDASSLSPLGDSAAMAAAVAACAYLSRQRHQQQRQKAREDMALRARLLPHKVGVKFDPTCPRWIAHWKRNGQRFFKSFSVEKNGFETAWRLAVNCRRANCEDYEPPPNHPLPQGKDATSTASAAAALAAATAAPALPIEKQPTGGQEEGAALAAAPVTPLKPSASAAAAGVHTPLLPPRAGAPTSPQQLLAAAEIATKASTKAPKAAAVAGPPAGGPYGGPRSTGKSSGGRPTGFDGSVIGDSSQNIQSPTVTVAPVGTPVAAGRQGGDSPDLVLRRAPSSGRQQQQHQLQYQLLLDSLSKHVQSKSSCPAKRGPPVGATTPQDLGCPKTPKHCKEQQTPYDLTEGLLLQPALPGDPTAAAADELATSSTKAAAAVAAAAAGGGNPAAAAQLLLEAEASLLRRISGALRCSNNSNPGRQPAAESVGSWGPEGSSVEITTKALQDTLRHHQLLLGGDAPDSPKGPRGAFEKPFLLGFATPTTATSLGSPLPSGLSSNATCRSASVTEAALDIDQPPASVAEQLPKAGAAAVEVQLKEEQEEGGPLLALLKKEAGEGRKTNLNSPRWSGTVFSTPHPEETGRAGPRASLDGLSSVITFSSTDSIDQGGPQEALGREEDDSAERLVTPRETESNKGRLQLLKAAVCLLLRDLRDVCLLSWVPYYVLHPDEEFECLSRCLRLAEDCEDEQQLQPFLSVFASLISEKKLPSTLPVRQQKDLLRLMMVTAKAVVL